VCSRFGTPLILCALQFENSLRRHNHVGLIHGLLTSLAKSGKLSQAEAKAKEAMKKRIEQRRARGGDMDEDD
jgi:ubiquitin carboxyl-terminal hydrolase L5